MKRWIVGLVVGSMCGVAAGQVAPVAEAAAVKTAATPALWRVKGAHGTVYLFGTVHVMRPSVSWETAKVKEAFGASGTLYLEVADISDDAAKAMQPVILQMGMDAEHPLSTKISKEDVALLDTAAKGMGAPGEAAFEPLKPWLVYLTLTVLPAVKAGYDPNSGIDKVLSVEAKKAGKTMKGFETVEQQVHYLADFPEKDQVELLHEELIDLPKSVGKMDEIVADWTRGDVEKIAAEDDGEIKAKDPALYDKLIVKRNERFAGVLGGLLRDPATGTVFVAVGAGHLAGGESVNKLLEKQGFVVERVE